MTVLRGDCVEVMAAMPAASVDAIVCDPPYEISFMAKAWDGRGVAFNPVTWKAAMRVLKPGGHLLAFGGTRTYHRLACAIEDAGFEIRDCIAWMYGSGFPKSHDVSKAIDKAAGAEGSLGEPKSAAHAGWIDRGRMRGDGGHAGYQRPWMDDAAAVDRNARVYVPGSEAAMAWRGWGTALKPAYEPIVVARKPLVGTVAGNVLAHGTGALNVDGCRVAGPVPVTTHGVSGRQGEVYGKWREEPEAFVPNDGGRWPANVVLTHHEDCVQTGLRTVASTGHFPAARPAGSPLAGAEGHAGQTALPERHTRGEQQETWDCVPDCPVRLLDAQSEERGMHSAGSARSPGGWASSPTKDGRLFGAIGASEFGGARHGDSGGASRFFYTAKASRAERNAGLDDHDRCVCETNAEWVNVATAARRPGDTEPSPPRDTVESGTRHSADSEWSTTSSGRNTTDPSPPGTKSTTATRTNSTTTSTTSSSSTMSPTNDITHPTTDSPATGHGNDAASSAATGNQPPPSTSTSPARDGSRSGDAARATSDGLSSESRNSDANVSCDCGGVIKGALRNSHPT